MKIECIATGNELLDGSICDRHSQGLAQVLNEFGLRLQQSQQIPDDHAVISAALIEASQRSDWVVVTGGLGPTTDDMTLEVAAEAFGVKMQKGSVAEQNVTNALGRSKGRMNPGNEKQMRIPKGAKAHLNPYGTAPFVEWKVGRCRFLFLPGVPREFESGLQTLVKDELLAKFKSPSAHLFIAKIFGWRESELNEKVKALKIPEGVELGFRTHLPENHIKLRVLGKTRDEARQSIQGVLSELHSSLGSALFTFENEEFAEVFLKEFQATQKKIVCAESCTGGMLSSMITQISGSSSVLERSFVTYSNEAKQDLLGVSEETLRQHGAVSEQVAVQMAEGALKNSRADFSVGITGIAGPTGGSTEKPVGLIWLAAKSSEKSTTKKLQLPFDRLGNQRMSAYWAIQMLRELNSQPSA